MGSVLTEVGLPRLSRSSSVPPPHATSAREARKMAEIRVIVGWFMVSFHKKKKVGVDVLWRSEPGDRGHVTGRAPRRRCRDHPSHSCRLSRYPNRHATHQ